MYVDRSLCFILPADSDEIKPYNHHSKIASPTKKKPQRQSCSDQILALLQELLGRFRNLKWRSSREQPEATLFFDAAGAELSDKVGCENPRIFSFAELYIGSKGFSEEEVLGSGGFGKVYRAVLPSDGTVVAVKCLAERGEQFEKTFAAELVAVAHLRHRNLVRLRGWCVHEDQLLLVYDYMPNRSLDRILFRRQETKGPEVSLSWERRQRIVAGLAAALYYLHEQLETQIIHRDVKTSNVMLDSHFNARLGDFGLARWLEHGLEYKTRTPSMGNNQFRLAETTRIGGTIGYLPPESFQKRSTGNAKADVFSFGVVVLEVVSGRRAVDLTYPDDQIVLLDYTRRLSDEGRLLQVGDNRLPDGSFRLTDMERLIHLGLLCTLHEPQSRPNMKWVVETLSTSFNGKLPPLPSFRFHPLYTSLSSQTNTSTSSTAYAGSTTRGSSAATTATSISSNYLSAVGETIYVTAEIKDSKIATSEDSNHQLSTFPVVETPREISYNELILGTNNFSETNRVAEVDFGTAYHGILQTHHHILVKRLGMKTCPALRARFSNELQNLGRLRHRNLVQLRGWCTEQGEMLVVYDYSASRLLSHLLFHHNHKYGQTILFCCYS